MNLNEKIIEEIKIVAANYDNISKILLFGSRERGDNHSQSDIDLAVYSTDSISLFVEEINTKGNTCLLYTSRCV